jgi:hypothetical protein
MGVDIIQPSWKTHRCSWNGGESVFHNIDTGDCNLFETIDRIKAKACRDLRMCKWNYSATEMLEKLGGSLLLPEWIQNIRSFFLNTS